MLKKKKTQYHMNNQEVRIRRDRKFQKKKKKAFEDITQYFSKNNERYQIAYQVQEAKKFKEVNH